MKMNEILSSAFLAAMLMLPACRTPSNSPARPSSVLSAPYYRVFRGVVRGDISREEYLLKLSTSFIPALPPLYAGKGGLAYIPALPPEVKPAAVADEFALVAFESEEAYRAARATPEGQRYGDLHWTVFDRERTRTGGAVSLGSELVAETPYDVLGKPVDWQTGYASFYIGLRKKGVAPEEFLKKMGEHVRVVAQALAPLGLDGYVMVAGADYEAAYLHWPSQKAAEAAFASDASRPVMETGAAILDNLLFVPVEPFTGTIKEGQALNVELKRRS